MTTLVCSQLARHGHRQVMALIAFALAMLSCQVTTAEDAAMAPDAVLRRLTRVEYVSSLRDLFGIEFPFAAELPPDGQAAGFDNISDALSLSPLLLESYLKVARKVGDMVLGTGSAAPLTAEFPATDTQYSWQEGLPMGTRGGLRVQHYFSRSGEYDLRAILDYQLQPTEGLNSFRMRVPVKAGLHSFVVTFPQEFAEGEGPIADLTGPNGVFVGGPVDSRGSAIRPVIQFWLDGKKIKTFSIQPPPAGEYTDLKRPGPLTLRRSEITGPFNAAVKTDTEARRRLMICSPRRPSEETSCAAKLLGSVAARAYRRDLRAEDMPPIMALFAKKRASASFDQALAVALCRILVSPDFLFRMELDAGNAQAGQPNRVSDFELATRLSYFLWSSMPDAQLLQQARSGQLHEQASLEREVRRMLSDPKADALVDNFAIQWLGLKGFYAKQPDPQIYPEFEDGIGHDFQEETRLFLRSLIRDNRSVLDMISSNYAFLNERLARFYGVAGVQGSAFREVKVAGAERGGILGQGSVLLMTSHSASTSPVLRGKWVLTNLLNSPPPPPPPGVPPLDTKPAADGRVLTAREQMERHRSSPACNSCHAKMDPFGIALENYDVIGRWRVSEHGTPIDSSTRLPQGIEFTGPHGLKKVLLDRSGDFVSGTVSRLLAYALGRELRKSDNAIVRAIAKAAEPQGYRFADLVIGIVNSAPFQMRQTRAPEAQVAQTKD